ncbi:hypothetical protein B0H11DRAFT_2434490 [Mycena galericulata]|nr:hypothetical protein B0H11DRAFT_2434490 [Mycena galericulata]
MPHPKITDKTFSCPKPGCGRRLHLKLCSNGPQKDRYFLACFNEAHSHYWHFFARGEAPPAAERPRTQNPRLPPAPGTSNSAPRSCSSPRCTNTRVNRSCPRHMCRRHCLDHGGCPCHVAEDVPSWTGGPLDKALTAHVDAGQKRLEVAALAQMRTQQAAVHTLAQMTPLPPSPTLSQELEYSILTTCSSPPVSPRPAPSLVSSSSRTSSTSFSSHLRGSSTSEECRLVLFYWPNNGPVVIQAFQDASLRRSWPRISLRDIAHLLVTDEQRDLEPHYDCFSSKYHSWMKINVDYQLKVSEDEPIFVRRVGITGTDEKIHLPPLIVPATPPHQTKTIRNTIIVKTPSGKGKKRARVTEDAPDDEVIVVAYRPVIKHEVTTPPRPAKRARCSISTPPQPITRRRLSPLPSSSSTSRSVSPYFPELLLPSPRPWSF